MEEMHYVAVRHLIYQRKLELYVESQQDGEDDEKETIYAMAEVITPDKSEKLVPKMVEEVEPSVEL